MKHVVARKVVKLATKKMEKKDMQYYTQKKDVEHVLEDRDIAYSVQFCMDHYMPKKKISKNLYILDIHGGAWMYGKKELNRHFCMHLANGGYSVFNMDYGLAPDYSVKQQIQQIFEALQFIQEHKKDYGLENARVCLCGDSAGAHLASLAACIVRDKELQKVYEVNAQGIHVAALLLQHGVYDLTPLKKAKTRPFKILYHWLFPNETSTLKHVDCLDAILDEQWDIPMFLLSSKEDKIFSFQTIRLEQKLIQLKIPHEALIWDASYDTLQHVFHIIDPDKPESKESVQRMLKFLNNLS